MGLVTIDEEETTENTLLKIPNYSIKTVYREYIENIIMELYLKIFQKSINFLA